MSRPNLDNISLRPGEREELEQLFAYTEKLREEMKRDPEVARQFLKRVGYYEIMEDERAEQEALRDAAQANGHPSNGSSSDGERRAA